MRTAILCAALAMAALPGCGGDNGDEGTGGAGGTGGSGGAPGEPTYADVAAQVITPVACAGPACHAAIPNPPPGAFSVTTPEATHAALVDQPATGSACGTSGLTRVVPGDAEASLLYLKLAGEQPCGDEMSIAAPLDSEKVDLVRRWIEGGALP